MGRDAAAGCALFGDSVDLYSGFHVACEARAGDEEVCNRWFGRGELSHYLARRDASSSDRLARHSVDRVVHCFSERSRIGLGLVRGGVEMVFRGARAEHFCWKWRRRGQNR